MPTKMDGYRKKKTRLCMKIILVFAFVLSITYCYAWYGGVYEPEAIPIVPSVKYILQWTSPDTDPFMRMGKGQNVFINSQCPMFNCYVTSAKHGMKRLTDFHAILFHGPELARRKNFVLPEIRSTNQTYIFVSMESSHYYPIKEKVYQNFFNWTWTYKLNSDLFFGYMIVKDETGQVVGPKENMHWLKHDQMLPINSTIKHELSSKFKTAAWFVSNCKTPSKREKYVDSMIAELKLFNRTVDIFGRCGTEKCERDRSDVCDDMVKREYYFYLSFENSFSDDYVTEKLLTALGNNAIPIVFGRANYTRFMPDGAYLNAYKLSPKDLVKKMMEIIDNKELYYEYFRWRNHYSYHTLEDSAETNPYCILCSRLNELDNITETPSFYNDFEKWWNN